MKKCVCQAARHLRVSVRSTYLHYALSVPTLKVNYFAFSLICNFEIRLIPHRIEISVIVMYSISFYRLKEYL